MDSHLRSRVLFSMSSLVVGVAFLGGCASRAPLPGAAPAAVKAPVDPATASVVGQWHKTDFDVLLAKLEAGQTMVVEVGADWCGPCNQLEWEVIETPRGTALLAESAGLRIDFETPEGQQFAGRYRVINLPTTLVINHAGREIGRVEGYNGADEYVEGIRDAQHGPDQLAALEAKLALDPKDPTARLDLARAKLFAGQTGAALPVLDELGSGDGVPSDIAAEATRIQGRWLLRVRHDAEAATRFFTKAAARFEKDPKSFAHFTYWKAAAIAATKRRDEAAAVMTTWLEASPGDARALSYAVEFFVHHKYPPAQSAELLARLVELDGWDADRRYTQARILNAGGDRQGALVAAKQAQELEPENALYRNYSARLASQ